MPQVTEPPHFLLISKISACVFSGLVSHERAGNTTVYASCFTWCTLSASWHHMFACFREPHPKHSSHALSKLSIGSLTNLRSACLQSNRLLHLPAFHGNGPMRALFCVCFTPQRPTCYSSSRFNVYLESNFHDAILSGSILA